MINLKNYLRTEYKDQLRDYFISFLVFIPLALLYTFFMLESIISHWIFAVLFVVSGIYVSDLVLKNLFPQKVAKPTELEDIPESAMKLGIKLRFVEDNIAHYFRTAVFNTFTKIIYDTKKYTEFTDKPIINPSKTNNILTITNN